MSAEDEIAALGRDLHYLGVCNSVEIPTKLYEMGWRKNPKVTVVPQVIPAPILAPLAAPLTQGAVNPNHYTPRTERWMR